MLKFLTQFHLSLLPPSLTPPPPPLARPQKKRSIKKEKKKKKGNQEKEKSSCFPWFNQSKVRMFNLALFIATLKSYAIQLKWVLHNETHTFCFSPILWPPAKATESGIQWEYSMIMSVTGMKEFDWNVCMPCPTLKCCCWGFCFFCFCSATFTDVLTTAGRTRLITSIHVLFVWIKKWLSSSYVWRHRTSAGRLVEPVSVYRDWVEVAL